MNIRQRIIDFFSKRTPPPNIEQPPLNESEQASLKEFSFLNADERIRKIMIAGDTGNPDYFHLMQYAVLNDPDMNVKFAALKRIYLFSAHPGLLPMMKKLQETNPGNAMEPYLSMALSRLGLITREEFEQKMNGVE